MIRNPGGAYATRFFIGVLARFLHPAIDLPMECVLRNRAERSLTDALLGTVPLSAVDQVCIELGESDLSSSHMHLGGVMVVPGVPPPVSELGRLVAERVDRAPGLRYRLSRSRKMWEPDPDFDVRAHVEERLLAPGADVRAEALKVIDKPLPSQHPWWRLVLLNGHDVDETGTPRSFALCYYAHHAFQDGIGVATAVEALFGTRTLPPLASADRGTPRRRLRWPAPTDLSIPLRRATGWIPADYAISGQRRMVTVDLDQEQLRETARAAGASRNTICLAALAGALRDWAPELWAASRRRRGGLRIGVPVALQPQGGYLGNQAAVLTMSLPCHRASAEQRLRDVQAQTQLSRLLRHRELYRALVPRAPRSLIAALYRRMLNPRYMPLIVTTVPLRPLAVGGTTATSAFSLPSVPPRYPAFIAIVQYRGRIVPSVLADTNIDRIDELVSLWHESLAHLHTSVHGSTPDPDAGPARDRLGEHDEQNAP